MAKKGKGSFGGKKAAPFKSGGGRKSILHQNRPRNQKTLMARRPYRFTPARRAALAKAQAASAKSRKSSATKRHSKSLGKAAVRGALTGGPAGAAVAVGNKAVSIGVQSTKRRVKKAAKPFMPKLPAHVGKAQVARKGRGVGYSGLKRNAIPYARVNKRGSTVGANTGTIIPGTNKRIVIGGYARVETTSAQTSIDRVIGGRKAKFLGVGTKRAKAVKHGTAFLKKHGVIRNPALRMGVAGSQVRLGTSRKGGATVIVRRGSHRTSTAASRKGVQRYDRRMSTIAGRKAKKPRPQRRKAARKRK